MATVAPLPPRQPNPNRHPMANPSYVPTAGEDAALQAKVKAWFEANRALWEEYIAQEEWSKLEGLIKQMQGISRHTPPLPVGWLFGVGLCLATLTMILPPLLHRQYPGIGEVEFHWASLAALFHIVTIWCTFRDRLCAHFGWPEQHPHRIYQAIVNIGVFFFAVGDPAYRAAPLSKAWIALTAKERLQTGRFRVCTLLLTMYTTSALRVVLVAGVFSADRLSPAIIPGDSGFHTFAGNCIAFVVGACLGFCTEITRALILQLLRIANKWHFAWETKHPLLRGVIDQTLATYFIPNPPRDRDLAAERQLGLMASAS